MNVHTVSDAGLDPKTRDFYVSALTAVLKTEVPFLVGGAYALSRYTGIERHTKDLDIFVTQADVPRILECLERQGYRTDLTFPHWLAKARYGDDFIDVIFGSGNGVARVDESWFAHAVGGNVFGIPVKLVPPEEILWSKGLVQERERYDGADVAHLLRFTADSLDWRRLLARYGEQWRALLSHLVLFGFIYPGERDKVPGWLMGELLGRLRTELASPPPPVKVCNGTLLSREQYLVDVHTWGYQDGRVAGGFMRPRDVAHWTAAIEESSGAEHSNGHGDGSDVRL